MRLMLDFLETLFGSEDPCMHFIKEIISWNQVKDG